MFKSENTDINTTNMITIMYVVKRNIIRVDEKINTSKLFLTCKVHRDLVSHSKKDKMSDTLPKYQG